MIEWVVERFISLIPVAINSKKSNREGQKEKREIDDKALTAISDALSETSIYVNAWRKNGERNLETEKKLVKLWGAAAIPVRHLDKKLSEICEYKSEYWINPDNWNPEKTKGLAIDLERVRNKYREKLN